MKKLLIGIVVVIALLVGVAWVVGSRAPLDHVATVRTELAAEPETVWTKVADLATWNEWSSAVNSMERRDEVDGRPAWLMRGKFGDMPMVVEEEGPWYLLTRIPADADIGFHGTWSYHLEQLPEGGCALITTETGTIPSPFFRFLYSSVLDPHASMVTFARDLGESLGEEVEPEVVEVPAGADDHP